MIDTILNIGWDALKRLFPDPADAAKAKLEYDKIMSNLVQAQLEINKTEASHTSLFVAGWRPAVGWICAAALGWNFLIAPIIEWILLIVMIAPPPPPELNSGELVAILTGMLGLSGVRMTEKLNGVARESLKAGASGFMNKIRRGS